MRVAGGDEALVQHIRGGGKAGVQIAHHPFFGRLALGQTAFAQFREIRSAPAHVLHAGVEGVIVGAAFHQRRAGHIATHAGAGAVGSQTGERVHREGQAFELDDQRGDGVFGRLLVHGRYRQDGLAHIHRLIGQDLAFDPRQARHIVRRQDAHHARNLQRLGGVDAQHPRVGNRAGEQTAEHHAVHLEILCVLRRAGHLGADVGRGVVLANQGVSHRGSPASWGWDSCSVTAVRRCPSWRPGRVRRWCGDGPRRHPWRPGLPGWRHPAPACRAAWKCWHQWGALP
jgi:hypothetical protein